MPGQNETFLLNTFSVYLTENLVMYVSSWDLIFARRFSCLARNMLLNNVYVHIFFHRDDFRPARVNFVNCKAFQEYSS